MKSQSLFVLSSLFAIATTAMFIFAEKTASRTCCSDERKVGNNEDSQEILPENNRLKVSAAQALDIAKSSISDGIFNTNGTISVETNGTGFVVTFPLPEGTEQMLPLGPDFTYKVGIDENGTILFVEAGY